jgi:hypothetical protein
MRLRGGSREEKDERTTTKGSVGETYVTNPPQMPGIDDKVRHGTDGHGHDDHFELPNKGPYACFLDCVQRRQI